MVANGTHSIRHESIKERYPLLKSSLPPVLEDVLWTVPLTTGFEKSFPLTVC